jgi:hypothetical protein
MVGFDNVDAARERSNAEAEFKAGFRARSASLLTAEQLAECFRRIPGQPGIILQDEDLEFEAAFRAGLDRLLGGEVVPE